MNEYYAAKVAGFTDAEIQAGMMKRGKAAGFTDQETNAEIFQQSISPDQQAYDLLNKPNPALLDYFGRSFAKAQSMPAPKRDPYANQLGGADAAIVDPATKPGEYIDVTSAPETTYGQAFSTGINQSIVGLFMAHLAGQDKAPKSVMGNIGPAEFKPGLTPEQQQDLPQGQRLALQAAQVSWDLPAMALGALAGAAEGLGAASPVTAAAGAFAMPAALRSILMAEYEKGQIQTPTDFIQRAAVAMWEAAKGGAVGAATYGAGAAAKVVSPLFQVPAEVLAMTTAGAAVEGHLPAARDFVDGALLIAAMHGATSIGGPAVRAAQDITPKLREVYAKTGVRPEQIIEDIKSDPSIREDIMSTGKGIPKAYETIPSLSSGEDTLHMGGAGFTKGMDPNRPAMPTEPVGADGVTKISDVVKLLEEKLGAPIRTGKFRDDAAGIYKSRSEVIRTETANDISVIAHEVGHHIQKTIYGDVGPAQLEPFRGELGPLATKPKSGQSNLPEGFAEFISRYIQDGPEAQKVAPKFYADFEAKLDAQAPDVKAVLLHARDMVQKWREQPAVMRVLSHISVGDTGPSFMDKVKDPQTYADLYTKAIDRLNPLDNVVKEGLKPGEKLPADVDPYKLARVFAGWTGKGNHFLETSPFEFKTFKNIGKPLEEPLKAVENLDELRAYLIAKSALERGERGMHSPDFLKDSQAVVSALGEKYAPVAKEIYEFKDHVLNYMRDAGLISAEKVATMREAWQSHVPFYRVMEDANTKGGVGKSLQARNPIKKAKGSGRDIIDPLESIIKDTYTFINLAERNEVMNALVAFTETHEGLGKYVEKIPNPMSGTKVQTEEILKAVEKSGVMGADEIKQMFGDTDLAMAVFRPDSYLDKKSQIALFRDGKRTVYQVDPKIAEVVHNLNGTQMNDLIRLLSVPSRMLRVGATSTPEFLLSNMVKDTFSAAVYSQYGFLPVYDTVRGIFHMFNKSDLYHEWQKSGGEHFAMVGMDRESLQKNLATLTETGALDNVRNIIRHPLEMARLFGEFSESGTRVGEYVRAREKLGDSKAAMIEAGLASRDLMDFSRKGGSPAVQLYSQITAFWNARLQGTDKLIRAFKTDPAGTAMRAAAIYTVPSIMLAMSNYVSESQKDQDYVTAKAAMGQELTPEENRLFQRMTIRDSPDWMKDMFWQIPAGPVIVRIPKGFELGILFASVPERITNWILGQVHKNGSGQEFQGLASSILGGVIPAVAPTFAVAPAEVYFNKSTFTGGKIVPTQREGALPEVQYTPNTTRTMRELSRVIGELPNMRTYTFSPANAEQIIQGWTGGAGKYALQVTDWALRSAGVVPSPPPADWKISDVPAVKAFVVRYPSSSTQPIVDFYDNYQKSEQYVKAIGAYQKDFDFANAAKLMQENAFNVLAGSYQAMSEQTQAIHNIQNMPNMDGTKKREFIDSIYLQMNMTARAGNLAYKQVQNIMEQQKGAKK